MSDNPFIDEMDDVELPMLQEEPQKPKNSTNTTNSANPTKEDLQKRLEALKQREQQLNQRRQEVIQQRPENGPKLNWPSFFPILRYSPETDIPPAAKKAVWYSLLGLLVYLFESIWNLVSIFSVSGLAEKYSITKNAVFGIIFGVVAFFCILNFGYRKLYLACAKHDIPFSYTICQLLIILYCIYMLIGVPNSGFVGVAVLLDLIARSHNGWSIFSAVINVVLIATTLALQFLTFVQSQKYQKVSGHDSPALNQENQTEVPLNL